jgi:carbamoyl-phosphate synthase large subunit
MKVLITGAGALLGQGILKSLKLAQTPYHIIAADPDPRAVGLYWADAAYLIPVASASDYLEVIREILKRERPDAVLVGTDVELMTFAERRSELESEFNTHIVVSPPRVIGIADDKWLTYRFLQEHGFPCPHSALPESVDDLLNICDFPLIVKPRVGARSLGVSLVHTRRELDQALACTPNAIVQECVATPQDEYTSGLLATRNGVQAIVTMRRDLRDGNTYRAYVQPGLPFEAQLLEIASALSGWGPLNFQFRLANGIPKIFEINARFSGTTPLRAYAGFNEVDLLLRHIVYSEAVPPPVLRPVVVLRYWDEIVLEAGQLTRLSGSGQAAHLSYQHPFQV